MGVRRKRRVRPDSGPYNAGMRCPFPGMDPWLEQAALWPDVHNRLIAAIADVLSSAVAPRYYVALEQRTYLLQLDDVVFVGRPDVAVATDRSAAEAPREGAVVAVVDVEIPRVDEVGESFLEIRDVEGAEVVSVLELLSPANKVHPRGRADYERKRDHIFSSKTSLVEVDFLRAGRALPLSGPVPRSDYRILVSRSWTRPKAKLLAFDLRQAIPPVPIPLRQGEDEPVLHLGDVIHGVYERGHLDLRLRYDQAPDPPLSERDAVWAAECIALARSRTT